jgi:hypothetical protein
MKRVILARYRKEEWRNEGRVKVGRRVHEIVVLIRVPLIY